MQLPVEDSFWVKDQTYVYFPFQFCFQFMAIMNRAAVNIVEHVSLQQDEASFGYIYMYVYIQNRVCVCMYAIVKDSVFLISFTDHLYLCK